MIILMIAALLPALVLLLYIYKKDKVEPEPPKLLWKLLLLGAVAGLPASLIETVAMKALDNAMSAGTAYYFIQAFVIVAVAEEGCKFLMLKAGSWRHPAFNYRFDGIVYGVFVSLGFAALENILYVFTYGLSVAWSRALLSVPAHMSFGVFMGLYYAAAKRRSLTGASAFPQLLLAFLVPVLLHGFYDFCLISGTYGLMSLFYLFVIVLDVVVIRTVRRQANSDQPLEEYRWWEA